MANDKESSSREPSKVELLTRHGSTILYHGQIQASGRQVVLKIWLTPPTSSPSKIQQTYAQLRQEISTLQTLKHPHILSPLNVRKTQQGFVIVSEYVRHGSLQPFLQQPMSQTRAHTIINQIGEALQAAHQQGITHGNLTPNNILFLEQENENDPQATDQIALNDFYLSSLSQGQEKDSHNEHPQIRLYMAPEQFQGVRTTQTDQYALACIAYELFTGVPPFTGSARTTLQHKHTTALPVAPDTLNPNLLPAMSAAILKAMAKAPEERYAEIPDFLAALQVDKQATIPPVTSPHIQNVTAAPATKRMRKQTLLIASVLLGLLIGGSIFYIANDQTQTTNNSITLKGQTITENTNKTPTNLRPTPTSSQTSNTTTTAMATTTVTAQTSATPTATPGNMAGTATPAAPTATVSGTPPPIGPGIVKPILECIQPQGQNGYIAKFGYLNTSTNAISIPIGTNNMIVPNEYNNALPTTFSPGRQYATTQIHVHDNGLLVWMLNGSIATASLGSQHC